MKHAASLPYLLFSCSIFCSALLLFAVQPMISKALLPYFGGTAGVWGVALVFFQGVLCRVRLHKGTKCDIDLITGTYFLYRSNIHQFNL
jgi:hypothetical protein